MTRSSTPETSQLGALQAEYKSNRLTARILMGTGIVSVLISLISLFVAINRARSQSTVLSDSFRRDTIVINASLGLFMLLLAVFFFVYHRYHTSLRVAVYTDGFIFSDWRRSLACRWDEAVEVYESITRVYHRTTDTLRPGPRRWEYVVYRADGQRIKIAGLEGIVQLGQTLKTEILKRVLHRAVETYRAGGTVWFGPKLNLSQRGIGAGGETLPWREVAEVEVSERDNAVTVKQKGKRKGWKHVVGSRVANAWVLKVMVDRIHELNRSSEPVAHQASLHFPPDIPARSFREPRNRRIKAIAAAAILTFGLIFGGYIALRQVIGDRTRSKARYETKHALEGVCVGDGASVPEAAAYAQTSGLHPVMYVEKSGLGNWLSSYNYHPPAGWLSEEPVDTELVACLEEEQVEIERCPYTLQNGDSAVLVRLQWRTVVTLREARTGKVVAASETIAGEPPRACQESEQFTEGDLTEFISGERPEGGVEAWLEPYVEIP